MTDLIQPEPARQGAHEPADLPESADMRLDHLLRRVQTLEQENRRWKRIGIGALVALLLLLLGGGVVLVGTASVYAYRLQVAHREAMEAKMRAREEAERARQQAQEAQVALEEARRAAERRQAEKEAK